jgi:hypothetical protein
MNKTIEADFFPQAVDGSSVDNKCMTRFPTGSHSKEGGGTGPNVVLENPTHAQWLRSDRAIKLDSMIRVKSLKGLIPKDSSDRSTLRPIAEPRWRLRKRAPLQLREAIPLWFALSSPLTGLILGFLGAWFVTWLTN